MTKEYSKNTKEDVIVTDKAGNTTKAEVNVTNIEKQELEAIVTYDIEDWTNKNVTATITANKPLKPQDDEWQLSENKMELTKTFDKNYLGNVEIESEAGNKKQVEVKIENIDKMEPTKPTLDVVYAEEGENNWYTSDEVIVKVTGGIDLD